LSVKAVLLHNGNTLPSIPVGHSVHNESYENMKILMEASNYDKFKWQICGLMKNFVKAMNQEEAVFTYL